MSAKNSPPATAKNQGTGASASSDSQPNATVQQNTSGSAPASSLATDNAGGLNIPTLGSGSLGQPPAQPVLQDGEDPAALMGHGANPASAGAMGQGYQQNTGSQEQPPQSLSDVQKAMDAAQPQRGQQALHHPAVIRQERYQEAQTPPLSLEMPVSGSLDQMRRPDHRIEPVPDMSRFQDHAAEMAFLEEPVIVRIHETNEPGAENPVVLGVNGRQVAIVRGQETIVRRKYVEQLLRAKPENLQTRVVRTGDGDVKNVIDKTRALKYPFSILRDDNPRGRAWEARIRAEA